MKISRRDFIHAGCAAAAVTLAPHFLDVAEARFPRGGSSGLSVPTGRTVQNGFSSITEFLYANFWKTWGEGGSTSQNGNSPTLLNANGYFNGTLSQNWGGTVWLPPTYTGQWVYKWTGAISGGGIFFATSLTEVGSSGFLSGSTFSGTNGRVVFTFNSAPFTSLNTVALGGTAFSGMSNIVLCRIADESAIDAGTIINPDFKSMMTTLNPNILRPMGSTLSSGSEVLTNPRYDYQPSLSAMSYGSTTPVFPPGAWAGAASGLNTITCGSYPDMPGSWTDKEVFQTSTAASAMFVVTCTIASPARFSFPKTMVVGEMFTLRTTGALPTGLTASTSSPPQSPQGARDACTIYYCLDAGTTNIRVSLDPPGDGVAVNTSGTQSGTHYMSQNTALRILGVANNGSGLPRVQLSDTSSLSTNQIVHVKSGESSGAYKIAVIDATHIDLTNIHPSGAAAAFSNNLGWSAGSFLTEAIVTTATINVNGRGAKLICSTCAIVMYPGFLAMTVNSTDNGNNSYIYDSALDVVVAAPGGLYAGTSLAVYIKTANELNKNLWVDPGVMISDASMTSMGTALATGLNSNLAAYMALSNETWARNFTQFYYLLRRGIVAGYSGTTSGGTQINYTATGMRTIEINNLARAAWIAAGRSASQFYRVISWQAFGDSVADVPSFLNGSGLPGPYNASPNRPIDQSEVGTYANYWNGVLINGDYNSSGTASDYAQLTTAADDYASGVPASMASAILWVKGDMLGTNGTATPPGTTNRSVAALVAGIWATWNTLAGTYDAGRAGFTPAKAPVILVPYEGGQDMLPPTAAQLTAMGISSAYETKIATLLTAFKNDTQASLMVQSACASFANASSFPHNQHPSFLQLPGVGVSQPWALWPTDLYGTPYYKLFDGVAAYNV